MTRLAVGASPWGKANPPENWADALAPEQLRTPATPSGRPAASPKSAGTPRQSSAAGSTQREFACRQKSSLRCYATVPVSVIICGPSGAMSG